MDFIAFHRILCRRCSILQDSQPHRAPRGDPCFKISKLKMQHFQLYFNVFQLDEMQYFALRVALSIKNRTCCSILQDSVKIHETASNSEFSKFTRISNYILMYLSYMKCNNSHSPSLYNRQTQVQQSSRDIVPELFVSC